MSISNAWLNSTAASTARKNKTSVISDTGDNLTNYDKTKFAIVVCTADGGIFVKDHAYLFGVDGTDVIELSGIPEHYHTGGSDGGGFIGVMMNTTEVIDFHLFHQTHWLKANWNQTVTGTGSIEDGGGGTTSAYIRLRPNGTSGSGATISYTIPTPVLAFDNPFALTTVTEFETASSLAAHVGVNADDVTAADSNTIKTQAEVCTTTNNNWWLRTANGSANSASDTGIAIGTGSWHVVVSHDPWNTPAHDKIHVSNQSTSMTKTTNIATSGDAANDKTIKFSVKNNTAADRPMRAKGARITYVTDATWGYGYADYPN